MKYLSGFFLGIASCSLIVGFWSHFSSETTEFLPLMMGSLIVGLVIAGVQEI